MENDVSIRSLFISARRKRKQLESVPDSTSSAYQDALGGAIKELDQCRQLIDRSSLFSSNESIEDVSSTDLQYLLTDYYLADLILKDNTSDRKATLRRAQNSYQHYLKRLFDYSILSGADVYHQERFLEDPDSFSLNSPSSDASRRRDAKIARFKQEKELQFKLDRLAELPHALQGDDVAMRELYLAEIELDTHHTFHALDMIAQEMKILALLPVPATPEANTATEETDGRNRLRGGLGDNVSGNGDAYSDRLDPPVSQLLQRGNAGPILDSGGKPLKPFTLLNQRQDMQAGVFRPGHNLPTMTIDEYLAEEKRRGGIVDGGGEASAGSAGIGADEDNLDRADQETMKAREWDEFVEANPKGSGNTINRG